MAARIVECVPNISAARDEALVSRIVASIEHVQDVHVLHVDRGYGANRTVITYAGEPEAVLEAGFRLVSSAAEYIDMAVHRGAHPRLGAVDVLPFVPVRGVSLQDCVHLSQRLGRRVGEELQLPVYLYEASATSPLRKNLADVRRGEYEGLRARLQEAQWKPDFGPAEFNPRFGALVTGARNFLVAYNVNLDTADLPAAQAIAAMVRERGKGPGPHLPGVKAIGWHIEEYGCAQVSMNLTDPGKTGLAAAFEACRQAAAAWGARTNGSELVGLVPLEVLLAAGRYYLPPAAAQAREDDLIELAVQKLGLNALAKFCPSERILERLLAVKSK